jgi:hypothetical protein
MPLICRRVKEVLCALDAAARENNANLGSTWMPMFQEHGFYISLQELCGCANEIMLCKSMLRQEGLSPSSRGGIQCIHDALNSYLASHGSNIQATYVFRTKECRRIVPTFTLRLALTLPYQPMIYYSHPCAA